jgi:HAD superfamily hydrolase (TIGR01549 family)
LSNQELRLSPNGIRAVFFDLDGTLRYNDPSPEKIFLEFTVQQGIQGSPKQRRRLMRWVHYYWAQSKELLQDRQTFVDAEDDFWLNYLRCQLTALECPPDLLEEVLPRIFTHMREHYHPQDRVFNGVPETLQTLKEAGFVLGLVSNRTRPFHDQLVSLKLEGYFDLVVSAGEIESWKPDPQIFVHALEALGLKANETLYVGDNYYADVLGARRAGLQPILLDPEGLFPEAGCPVLDSVSDLPVLLKEHQPDTRSYTRSDN